MTSISNTPPSTRMQFWPSSSHTISDGSCAPQNQHNWNQERLRYAKANGLDPDSLRLGNGSDCSSLRYRGDAFGKDDVDSEYDSGRSQAQVGTLKLELPVDEDDYLMPSPQQTQTASTYVDLISETSKSCDSDFCKTNIDNPEYLMGSEAPSQTLGIPTVSELVQANGPQSYMPQRSSEEESDHEYYNDFDRLQRELQPLQRKGETTV